MVQEPDSKDNDGGNSARRKRCAAQRRPRSEAARLLQPQHLADLRKSGLSDETIAACRFRSVEGMAVNALLGWKGGAEKLGPCLVIPFLDRDGNETGFVRLKPDRPRSVKTTGNERLVKYEQPRGQPVRPYFPPMAWPLIDDAARPLLITEGEKKAAKAAQEGFACIGLTGVDCWSIRRKTGPDGKPIGERKLLSELAALPLVGREVPIAFDSDSASKAAVGCAEHALARALRQVEAQVSALRFAPGRGGAKVALDDFLCSHAAGELHGLFAAADTCVGLDVLDWLRCRLQGGAEAFFGDSLLLRRLARLRASRPDTFAQARAALKAAGASLNDLDGALKPLQREQARDRAPVRLAAAGYRVSGGCIVRERLTPDGPVEEPLCNFTAQIREVVTRDDGAEQTTRFTIAGALDDGRALPPVSVQAADFAALGWITHAWHGLAVKYAGQGKADHLRTAIELLSRDQARRTVYAHTGWRQIGDRWHYLHAGGAIGPDGPAAGALVDLPDALAGLCLGAALAPVPLHTVVTGGALGQAARCEAAELAEAVRASLRMLEVAPERLTVPVLAGVYRAALGEAPGPVDFSLYLAGPHAAGKSELAALAQQHYGAGLDARHLPGSWSSTANALEGLAFTAKDALLVVDDYAPRGALGDRQRLERDADRLLRAQGNRAGRQRMRADGSLRPARPPRGMILSTGEDVPPGQSLRGRLLVLEVSSGDVPLAGLTPHQRAAAAGLYAQALAGFLLWLAPQYGELRTTLPGNRAGLRERALVGAGSMRTPGIVADLALGLKLFLDFAVVAGAITAAERDTLACRTWAALCRAGAAQAELGGAAEPAALFLRLLAGAIGTTAYVAGPDGGAPAKRPEGWGWHQQTYGTGMQERTDWFPCRQDGRIGWVDGTDLYLEPEASYAAAQGLARQQGNEVPVSPRTLWKRLKERGLLASCDDRRQRNTVRRSLPAGTNREVLHLRADVFSSCGLLDGLDGLDGRTQVGGDSAEKNGHPGRRRGAV